MRDRGEEKRHRIALLQALTDTELLDDGRFADPWPGLVHVTVKIGDAAIESVITRRSAKEMSSRVNSSRFECRFCPE